MASLRGGASSPSSGFVSPVLSAHSDDTQEISRRLAEQKQRQAEILARIQSKERQWNAASQNSSASTRHASGPSLSTSFQQSTAQPQPRSSATLPHDASLRVPRASRAYATDSTFPSASFASASMAAPSSSPQPSPEALVRAMAEEQRSLGILRDHTQKVAAMQSSSAVKDAIIARLKLEVEQLRRVENENRTLKAQVELAQSQRVVREEELSQKLQDESDTCDRLRQERETLRAHIEALQRRNVEQAGNFNVQIGDLEAKTAGAKADLERVLMVKQKADFEHATRVKQLEEELEREQKRCREVEAQLKQAQQQEQAYRDDIRSSDDKIGDLERELSSLTEALEVKDLEFNLLQNAKDTQSQLVGSLKEQLEALQGRVKNLQADAAQAQTLRHEVADLRQQAAQLQPLNDQLLDAESALASKDAAVDSVKRELDRERRQHRETAQQLDDVRGKYEALLAPDAELSLNRQRVSYLQGQLDEERERAEALQNSVKDVQGALARSQSSLAEVVAELQNKILLLQQELESAMEDLSTADSFGSRIVTNATELSGDVKNLFPELCAEWRNLRSRVLLPLLRQNSALQADVRQGENQNNALRSQLEQERQSHLTTRNQLLETNQSGMNAKKEIAEHRTQLAATEQQLKNTQEELNALQRTFNDRMGFVETLAARLGRTAARLDRSASGNNNTSQDLNTSASGDEFSFVGHSFVSEANNDVDDDDEEEEEEDSKLASRDFADARRTSTRKTPSSSPSRSAAVRAGPSGGTDPYLWSTFRNKLQRVVARLEQGSRDISSKLSSVQAEATSNAELVKKLQKLFADAQDKEERARQHMVAAHEDEVQHLKQELARKEQHWAEEEQRLSTDNQAQQDQWRQLCQSVQDSNVELKAIVEVETAQTARFKKALGQCQTLCARLFKVSSVLYAAYRPLQAKCQDLIYQKRILTRRNTALEKMGRDVSALMHAMTGGLSFNSTHNLVDRDRLEVRVTDKGPHTDSVNINLRRSLRSPGFSYILLFRVGVLAVIAARRLQRLGRSQHTLGKAIKVLGAKVCLLPSALPTAHAGTEPSAYPSQAGLALEALPDVDIDTPEHAIDGLLQVIQHFDRHLVSSQATDDSKSDSVPSSSTDFVAPTFDRLRYGLQQYNRVGHSRANPGTDELDVSVSIIRQVALALSSRIKDLEHQLDVQQSQAEQWQAEVTEARQQNQALDQTRHSAQRLLERLEARVKELSATVESSIPKEEAERLQTELKRATETEQAHRKRMDELSQLNAKLREQLTLCQDTVATKETAINTLKQANKEAHQDLQSVQEYLRRKGEDLLRAEASNELLNSQLRQARAQSDQYGARMQVEGKLTCNNPHDMT